MAFIGLTNMKRITILLSKKDEEYLKFLQEKLGESQSNACRSAISFYYHHFQKLQEAHRF